MTALCTPYPCIFTKKDSKVNAARGKVRQLVQKSKAICYVLVSGLPAKAGVNKD